MVCVRSAWLPFRILLIGFMSRTPRWTCGGGARSTRWYSWSSAQGSPAAGSPLPTVTADMTQRPDESASAGRGPLHVQHPYLNDRRRNGRGVVGTLRGQAHSGDVRVPIVGATRHYRWERVCCLIVVQAIPVIGEGLSPSLPTEMKARIHWRSDEGSRKVRTRHSQLTHR